MAPEVEPPGQLPCISGVDMQSHPKITFWWISTFGLSIMACWVFKGHRNVISPIWDMLIHFDFSSLQFIFYIWKDMPRTPDIPTSYRSWNTVCGWHGSRCHDGEGTCNLESHQCNVSSVICSKSSLKDSPIHSHFISWNSLRILVLLLWCLKYWGLCVVTCLWGKRQGRKRNCIEMSI